MTGQLAKGDRTLHQWGSCLTDLIYFRELSDDDALPKSISTKTESYNKHAIRVDDIHVGGNQIVSHVGKHISVIHNGSRIL